MDTASTILISLMALYLVVKFIGYLSRLGIRQITPKDLDGMKGIMLLDTRTDQEFKKEHIPGAAHVPLSEIGDRVRKLKKDKDIVVYCQSGNRSIWAIKRLMGMGYKNLYNLKGGYHAWKRYHH